MLLNGVLSCFAMKQTSSYKLDATMSAPILGATTSYRALHDSFNTIRVSSSSPPIASLTSIEL